jgi:hypothetical protein
VLHLFCCDVEVAAYARESLPGSTGLLSKEPKDIAEREKRLKVMRTEETLQPGTKQAGCLKVTPETHALRDPMHPMLAAEWHGTKTIKLANRASPLVTDPQDAIVRVTSTTICGSDLHLVSCMQTTERNE